MRFRLKYTKDSLSPGLDDGAEYGLMSQVRSTSSWQQIQSDLRKFLSNTTVPLIVIVGHTASGKTGRSIEIAKLVNEWKGEGTSEIVNADSRQLFKGFTIGTAKITYNEMEDIPHHLIDVLDAHKAVTISWFKEHAETVIKEIQNRKHVPILVGGSMLYVSSVIDGLLPLPERSEEVRAKLTDEYDKDKGVSLHHRLQHIDPQTAKNTSPNNTVHLIRAMEIYELTGNPPSKMKTKTQVPYDLFIIGCRVDAAKRKEVIEKRTKLLLENGWIDEVRALLVTGVSEAAPAMESVGYREIAEYLKCHPEEACPELRPRVEGGFTETSCFEELTMTIHKKTLHYAKRQITWWRRDERIRWID